MFKKRKQTIEKSSLEGRVANHQKKVNATLAVFADAYQEVEKAQEGLKGVLDEANVELAKVQNIIASAQSELNSNEKVKSKIAEFVPGKE